MLPTTHPPALTALADSLKEAWRGGAPPDAAGALRDHPELLAQRSLVVDLAYEEYCLREEAGSAPEPEEFCQRLPAFVSQVREVIRGHRVLADHPELFVAAATDWPEPGGGFEGLAVVRELGRGAFARAYLARDPETGDRPVVLKLAPVPSCEARTLGAIDHPHVVAVYWARRVRGLHAICMPFVGATTLGDVIAAAFPRGADRTARSGRTLLGAIDRTTAPHAAPLLTGRESYPEAAAAVVARLAGVLAHLHRQGVSHGDLKPTNIILAPGGHPYLIDFNLATGLDGVLLRLGGTIPYMAPERLRLLLGEASESGPAPTDVYSLGAVFFEALTGRVPVEPAKLGTATDIARDLLRRQPGTVRDVSAANPDVPPALARIVASCLDPDPRNRPTAEGLERALERYLQRRVRHVRQAQRAGAAFACVALAVAGLAVVQSPIRTPAAVAVRAEPGAVAVPSKPKTPDELFNRGVEYLRSKDTAPAIKDFNDAQLARPDGRNTAFLAYSQSRSTSAGEVADLYLRAIADFGYRPAWVYCNRADCLIRSGKVENYPLAFEAANVAVALEPGLRAARLNRLYARFLIDRDTKTQKLPNPDDCLADLRVVMADGPYTADLYYKAALVLTAGSEGREDRCAEAVDYLRDAVRYGWNPERFVQNAILKTHLMGRLDFAEVVKLPLPKGSEPAVRSEPAVSMHVVDPLDI